METITRVRVGGSFAPPITADKLASYKTLAASADTRTQDYMNQLITMLEKFNETPKSTLAASAHPSGRGQIIPLADEEIQRIWNEVPWKEELDVMGNWFDKLDASSQKDLRNAAFHLLWYGRELCLDREPITNDTL